MTQPNDMQAPDRIWAWEVDNDGWWDTDKPDWIEAPAEYIRADLTTSDWRPMETAPRDGTWFIARTASGYERTVHYADSADRLPIDHSGEVWSTVPVQWKALTPPADASAALDRLIVERVREAVTVSAQELFAAFRDVKVGIADNMTYIGEDMTDGALTVDGAIDLQALADWFAARASKEGRDG